jgi:transposase-like protein
MHTALRDLRSTRRALDMMLHDVGGHRRPEVPAKVQRRRFTAEYRRRILKDADACKKRGALGALLRREGLYSSHLVNWRRQREQGELVADEHSPREWLHAAQSPQQEVRDTP